jgi:hypothetical protein
MKKLVFTLGLCVSMMALKAQSVYLQEGSKDNVLLDRLEIKLGDNENLNINMMKPWNRKRAADAVLQADSLRKAGALSFSKADEYNLQQFYANNSEYAPADADIQSAKPIFKKFYQTKNNLLEVKNQDFFFVLNPIIYYNQSKQDNNSQNQFVNTRGIVARGIIANKIGFYTFLTDNQERDAEYVQLYEKTKKAVPGRGTYKYFKDNTAFDYWDARGGITFNASKFIDMQFAFDRNHIGNGFRSLFLSEFSNSMLFFKINTRIWKLQYTNLFMELFPQQNITGERLLDRKYATMHTLSFNLNKNVSIGLFEGVVFGRKNHFDFSYLNPIIFFRAIEANNGSPDNAVVGLQFKANIKKTVQVYGQFMLDEFVLSDFTGNKGNWKNKNGWQLGAKYVDALGIKNLDVQLELNRVRPYSYTHYDSVANYTHYNQPLSHPLGANFMEYVFLARYQPIPKLLLNARIIAYNQGDWGSDIFTDYRNRPSLPGTTTRRDDGFFVGSGDLRTNVLSANFSASYELKPNIFIDGNWLMRNAKTEGTVNSTQNTNVISLGLRMNVMPRSFDF